MKDRKSQSEKIQKFFNNIYPQNEKYEGCRQLWLRNSDGVFKQVFCCKTSDFYNQLQNFVVYDNCDYYITSNSSYADRRGTEYLFSADNLVFDLDNHSSDINAYELSHNISRLLLLLETKYRDQFPCPTATVMTGRGVQIWLHIDGISSKLLFLWKLVVNHFCDVLEMVCRKEYIALNVDRAVSCNTAGLFRLPFSFNTASLKYEKYIDEIDVKLHDVSYNIDQLIKRYNVVKSQRARNNDNSDKSSINKSDKEYKALHLKRIKFIEEYVERCNFDVVGQRNTIIFLYYNACVQVMERSSAVQRTEQLNKSFKKQYSESEFKTVVSAVDKHIYKFTNQTFFNMLGLSSEERGKYKEMSAYKPKIDRAERNKRIFQLAVQRKTCQQIADEVGCSERTVRTVLKDFDRKEFLAVQVKQLRETMTIKQVAEALNISTDTVKRLQKR
ncbi:MAG: helix-turn-helix domain-containing protein [Eubacterium sp.]